MNDESRSVAVSHDSQAAAPAAAEVRAPEDDDRRRNAPGRVRKKPLSAILSDIGADATQETVVVGDLITLLGGRGRAALILLFAFPNVLPAPPGLSGVLGLPLIYLSLQMMLGGKPWLPRFIGARGMPRERFAKLVERLGPWLAQAERLLQPRWDLLVSHQAERVIGLLCLVLAAVLSLPIPLGNVLPAFAICLVALGVLERDGIWVAAGTGVGVASLTLVAGIIYALAKSAIFLLLNAFA